MNGGSLVSAYIKISIFLLLLVGLPTVLFSATIYVPGDSTTIQKGIDGATTGDTVLVYPGIYTETIDFLGKAVAVISLGGREVTTIQSPAAGGEVVVFVNEEDSLSILDGFTIDGLSMSLGIICNYSRPIVQNCTIKNCTDTDYGWGIILYYSYAKIRYNLIYDNNAGHTDGGIGITGQGVPEITHNEIYNNTPNGGAGIKCYGNTIAVQMYYNLIRDNVSGDGSSAGIMLDGTYCEMINNTVVGNSKGIIVQNGIGSNIKNNIIVSNINEGIVPANATVDYNDAWDNGSENEPGINGISVDPQFISTAFDDYHLRISSPCIDAGDPDPVYNDPDDSRNDMGAFPYTAEYIPMPININLGIENPTNVVNNTPTFYWTYYDTTLIQAAYEIEVGTDDDWSAAEMWATGEVVSSDTFAVYSGATLEDGSSYFYRIRVSNGAIWGSWKDGSFRMNSVPSLPVALYPISDDTISINNAQMIVENSVDAEYDQLTYDFEIYSDASMTILVDSRYDVASGTDSTSSGLFSGLTTDTEYWWRIRSYDHFEYTDWTTLETFYTVANLTIHIPDDQPTIQAAINAAFDGDTVLVSPGTYSEIINFIGKAILVQSSEGRDNTTIEAALSGMDIVYFGSSEDSNSVLDGFTIDGLDISQGICCNGTGPIIQNCVVKNCMNHYDGGGMYCRNSSAIIRNNSIYNNQSLASGAGIGVYGTGNINISYNEIYANSSYGGAGIACFSGSNSNGIRYNLIRDNIGNSDHRGGIHLSGYGCNVINNTIVRNPKGITAISSGANILNNIIVQNVYGGLEPGTAYFDYNDVWNNNSGNDPGPNGIGINPLFLDPDYNDFTLQYGSACINAGDPAAMYNDPDGTRNDIGAFYYGTPTSADLPIPININLGPEVMLNVVNHTPTIYWAFYDSIGTQTAFEIEVGTDSDWTVAEMWSTGEIYSADTSITYAGLALESGATYYLRIRLNNGMNWGNWRGKGFKMNAIPTVPVAIYPISQQDVYFGYVQLIVENSSDQDSDPLVYDFEIYSDPGLTTFEAGSYDIDEGSDSTISGVFYSLSVHTEYWWRARTYDGFEYSDWSSAESFIADAFRVINVPEEQPTIQAGIDDAWDGDTILVAPGIYMENIDFDGKAIVLTSSGDRDSTIIQTSMAGGNTVWFVSGEDTTTVIDGLTIDGLNVSRGIACSGSGPIIRNCNIRNCIDSKDGGGIYCLNSWAKIRNNLIHNNHANTSGGGICVNGSGYVEISHNKILDNTASAGPGIGCVSSSSHIEIKFNLVKGNIGTLSVRGGIYIDGYNCNIINNTVVANSKGITILNGSGINILNNIVASNTGGGIEPAIASVDYNDAFANGATNEPGPNGINLDPVFVDAYNNDYTLMSFSPCIDAGDPDPQYDDENGTRNDIGAFPYGSPPPGNHPVPININFGPDVLSHVINNTPTIYWTFYDTTRGQAAYEIEVGTDNDWSVAEMLATGEVFSSDTSYLYAGLALEDGSIYYFRIRVSNGTTWGDWQYRSFRMNSRPSTPFPLFPDLSDTLNYAGVQLVVENSTDLQADPLTYDFEVYSDPGLTVIAAGKLNIQEGTDSTFSGFLEGLNSDAQYWWRARANDGWEYSDWSVTKAFYTALVRRIYVPDEYSTIQAGINATYDGDTVFVAPGDYFETINFSGKNIIVIGQGEPELTNLTAPNPAVPAVLFISGESPPAQLSGFTINGGSGDATIQVNNDSEPEISGNIMTGYTGSAVFINCHVSDPLIEYNLFYENGGISCIGIYSGTARIINNTFDSNARGFFTISNAGIAKNNIVTNSTNYGIAIAGTGFTELAYNDVWNNNPNYENLPPGTNDISLDPLYIDPDMYNYSLQINSPCINAGDPDPSYNDADGSRNDMGAFPSIFQGPAAININYGVFYIDHVVSTSTPTIYWTYFDTAATEQVMYQVQVGTDNDWSEAEMWDTGPINSSDTEIVYDGSPLSDNTIYYLRIRVNNGIEWGAWNKDYFIPHLNRIINIPSDLATIQEGIDIAWSGDTVLVAPGTYTGFINFNGKAVTVLSSDGRETTTIISITSGGNIVTFANLEDTTSILDGFTINGAALSRCIFCNGAGPIIRNCSIINGRGGDGGGILCQNSSAKIRSNLIYDNAATSSGGGIGLTGTGHIEISYNEIYDNSSAGGPGIGCFSASNVDIHHNLIRNNSGTHSTLSGGIYINGTSSDIINNTVVGNTRGITLLAGTGVGIYNNIVTSNANQGIIPAAATVDYNDIWGNGSANDPGPNGISQNPLFNTPSYDLLPTSPCINAGKPDTIYNDPDGTRNDMGAFPYNNNPPAEFMLLSPPDSPNEYVFDMLTQFSWEPSIDTDLNDSVYYTLYISIDSNFTFVNTSDNIWEPSYTLTDSLSFGTRYWWKVRATDRVGLFVYSSNILDFKTFKPGDANSDWKINIFDVTFLINYLYLEGPPPHQLAGDVNGDCAINIMDISYLITYLYLSGSEPVAGCD
jgi:hypothetical protein